jgi:peptidoglycan/xylan/chitin deacetylase (PgdA/CDA1 family)
MEVNAERRMGWFKQIREWAGQSSADGKENRILNQKELRILAQSRWATIGAHTVTHSPLSALSEEEQRDEIFSSKKQLEKLLGREITVFSYPFGKKTDYDQRSIRICGEAGFFRVAAAFPGQAYSWTDPYQIPRHVVFNWDVNYLATRLKGLWI